MQGKSEKLGQGYDFSIALRAQEAHRVYSTRLGVGRTTSVMRAARVWAGIKTEPFPTVVVGSPTVFGQVSKREQER